MKIGISTACFYNRCETEDAFNLIAQTGAETCEVYLKTFYEYRPEFAKKYAERLNGLKVNSVMVAQNNFEPQLASESRRVRGDGFYWLDQVMRSARLLGAESFSFRGQIRGGATSCDNPDYTAWWIRETSDFCARYGVKLCLENSACGTYDKPYFFNEIKARYPQLNGILNISEARKSRYPYQMYVKDMAGAIAYLRVSDVDENGRTCLPGEGIHDFKEVFNILKDEGFDGSVIIETDNYKEIEEVSRSVEYLKEIAYKL